MKTHKGIKKRVKVTATGKVKFHKHNKGHLQSNKSGNRRRRLRGTTTITGPYAHTRNPLYLGSMLIAFGFALASRSIWIALALAALFALIYIPVIRSEEAFLRSKFSAFDGYAARVPRLLPRLTPAPSGDPEPGSFSPGLYRKHREYNALIGAAAIYAALALRIYFFG